MPKQAKEHVGYPFKGRQCTKDKVMMKYARLLVEMPLDGNFPEYIEFANEKDILIRQRVKYKWLPLKCSHCRMFETPKMFVGRRIPKGKNGG